MYSGLKGIHLPLCIRDVKITLMYHFEAGKTTGLILKVDKYLINISLK